MTMGLIGMMTSGDRGKRAAGANVEENEAEAKGEEVKTFLFCFCAKRWCCKPEVRHRDDYSAIC